MKGIEMEEITLAMNAESRIVGMYEYNLGLVLTASKKCQLKYVNV